MTSLPPSRASRLRTLGQSVWLDFIRRGHLLSGEFDQLVAEQGVVGVTSNPTIFQQAIANSHDYDQAIQKHVASGLSGTQLYEALAIDDIQLACDRLRGVYDQTHGLDGRVSIEVNPTLSNDTTGTITEAHRLYRQVNRPNVMIKVPATPAGLEAVETLVFDGVSINVTLIFTLERYHNVVEAYVRGLEKRLATGQSIDQVFSVASFFISRVDTKIDSAIKQHLTTLPADDPRRVELVSYVGKTAIANARLAYAYFTKFCTQPRWLALATQGGNAQRPLWASTGTKNPAYSDTLYIDELIGPETVNTVPLKSLSAYNDHGSLTVRLDQNVADAQRLFERLPMLGVPVNELIGQLENEGVILFTRSLETLLAALNTKRAALQS